jgi:hypothetical protein
LIAKLTGPRISFEREAQPLELIVPWLAGTACSEDSAGDENITVRYSQGRLHLAVGTFWVELDAEKAVEALEQRSLTRAVSQGWELVRRPNWDQKTQKRDCKRLKADVTPVEAGPLRVPAIKVETYLETMFGRYSDRFHKIALVFPREILEQVKEAFEFETAKEPRRLAGELQAAAKGKVQQEFSFVRPLEEAQLPEMKCTMEDRRQLAELARRLWRGAVPLDLDHAIHDCMTDQSLAVADLNARVEQALHAVPGLGHETYPRFRMDVRALAREIKALAIDAPSQTFELVAHLEKLVEALRARGRDVGELEALLAGANAPSRSPVDVAASRALPFEEKLPPVSPPR